MATAVHPTRQARVEPPRRLISFDRLVQKIMRQFGARAALRWTKAVLGHQAKINEKALLRALKSGNAQRIEKVLQLARLQRSIQRVMQPMLQAAAVAAGTASASYLEAHGVSIGFNAVHPDVVQFARRQAAELVVDIPVQTRQVIAEVIAMGAQRGITVVEQARAIREVVGLPPNWAQAPLNLAHEITSGNVSAATRRRLSAADKQQIRSRIKAGTADKEFVKSITKRYTEALINRRALNIARTESLRAAHHGVTNSWIQGQRAGALPLTARKYWIVTKDARLSIEHSRIPAMNPIGRKMNESFLTSEGLHMFPPSRPNCRCTVALGFLGRR